MLKDIKLIIRGMVWAFFFGNACAIVAVALIWTWATVFKYVL